MGMTRTIEVDEATAAALERLAADRGVTVPEMVAELAAALNEDWAEDFRRAAEYDRTGESISLEEGVAHFRNAVEDRIRSKE